MRTDDMKRNIQIALDITMLLLTITLYDKRLISAVYHEIAGLVLIAIVAAHILLNIRVIKAMCKGFGRAPVQAKARLIVDILLLLCFLWIGVSGIQISRVLFTGILSAGMGVKMGHLFAGGLSVILLGVHLGLHISRKPMPAIAAALLTVAVSFGGVFGMLRSKELSWLTAPFAAAAVPDAEENGNRASDTGASGQHMNADARGRGERGKGRQGGAGKGKNAAPLTMARKAENVWMFFSMLSSFAMLTYWVAVPKKKKQPPEEP